MLQNDINFEVETKDVYVEGKLVPRKIALVRSDTRKVLSIASTRYKVVNHQNIIHNIGDILEENRYVFNRNDVVCKDGARVYSSYQFSGIEFNIGENDKVTLTLILKNSYDSGCRISFNLGGHRLCNNVTLAVSKSLVHFSQSHTTNFKDDMFVKQIANVIMQYGDNVIPFWNRLFLKDISNVEGVDIIRKVCEEKIFPERYAGDVIVKWSNPFHVEDKPRNLWTLYNAFVTFIHQNVECKKYERAQELKQKLDSYFYNLI